MKTLIRPKNSSLFLVELIAAICFFTVAAAISVQLFVKAHNLSQEASELDFASRTCSNVAEIVYASDSRQEVKRLLGKAYDAVPVDTEDCWEKSGKKSDTCLVIYFDENNNQCGREDAAYCACVRLSAADELLTAYISLWDKDDFTEYMSGKEGLEACFSLTAKTYTGGAE